jgi:NAD(P)-dependent dehydrogenase (short-subunit alcohol dehydrogenase family)
MNEHEPKGGVRLAGKVALVVGGTSGIGRAIAVRYGEEGASVVVASRTPESNDGEVPTHELIARAGGVAHYAALDVSDRDAADGVVKAAVERMGGLDILVFSAGAIGGAGDSRDVDPKEFDHQFDVDVRGAFVCAQAALRHFVPNGYGKIVNVTSNFGLVGVAGLAVYCSAKAAVIGLTQALAVEYGASGININALCPGATKTATGDGYRQDPAVMETWRRMTPLRMPGDVLIAEASDIANAALFLGSDESRFMTGACLVVDGGWTAL